MNSRETFLQEIDQVIEDFFGESQYPAELMESTKEMIHYMIPDYNRIYSPFLLPKLTRILKPNLTNEELKLAESLGWIYQMLESYLFALDDFVDEGDMRYGKLSWSELHKHSKSHIVLDVSIMRAVTYYILRRMFANSQSIYFQVLHFFLDCDNSVLLGRRLEAQQLVQCDKGGKFCMKSFSIENYNNTARLKTSALINLIVALAMTIAGLRMEDNEELYQKTKGICGNLGILTQIYDDYYDIFNPPTEFDSTDTDIRRGQLSWLFLKAMENCGDDDQKALLKHYGRDNDESVGFVRRLYENIGMEKLFSKNRDEYYKNIGKEVKSTLEGNDSAYEMITYLVEFCIKHLDNGLVGLIG